ncbi:MAG TPA: dipeptide/oligopeptide/nickel ABC transporter permease/ATP-binding protein [Pseudonocardiaceae bacterium]|nr:dipeptide/oligopeptide/nickel ABC transporter permease/ATP-binding protein [Pseudonocardiaceae bacterium]
MTIASASASSVVEPAPAPTAARTCRAWRVLLRKPLGRVAAGYLLVVVVASVGAPVFAPTDPAAQDLAHALSGPSAAHWLGTDRLGRDVLSRLMFGGQITLLSTVEATVVFAVLGVGLGLVAGFRGGWVDGVTARFADLVLALPAIIVLLMVVSVFPGDDLVTMVALGVLSCPTLLRVVRGQSMALRQELYVKAARLAGLTNLRIMIRHILPRLTGPVIVQLSLFSAVAVLVQAALSFLGLSTPETRGPSWGNMVGEASQVLSRDQWLLVPTGGVLVLTVLALGLLGDAVWDVTVGRFQRTQSTARRPVMHSTVDTEHVDALLSVRGLTIAFPGEAGDVTVVQDVSFDVAAGEAVGIVGESGCGKTMTARGLLGLLPDGGRIIAGSARFEGRDLARLTEREHARVRGSRIGLISQEPMAGLDPSFRVGSQLVEVVRRHSTMSRRQGRARALELLDLVNLPEPDQVARRYPHELSGGMAQRVAIALALAGDPVLLVADEPTTALDVTVQAEILALLADLRARLGMAVILVTHDWGVLADLCDRAVVMYAGQIVEQAGVTELYRAPRHPYTEGLLAANPHLAATTGDLPAIPGTVPPPSAWPVSCHFLPRCRYATESCGAEAIPLGTAAPGHLTRCVHSDQLVAR